MSKLSNPTEVWKPISGYHNYEVSNLGSIRKVLKRGGFQFKKLIINNTGYCRVWLSKNYSVKVFYIHRLVALAFIPNKEDKPCVNHKNGIKTDNCVENLEWATYSQNMEHAYILGLRPKSEIYQYNVNGDFIKRWDGLCDVESTLGYDKRNLHKYRDTNIISYGYRWKSK